MGLRRLKNLSRDHTENMLKKNKGNKIKNDKIKKIEVIGKKI